MKNVDVEFIDHPIEVFILRDGKTLMSQVFRHTPIRFGRILENDIVLPFEGVSRHHCVLQCRDGKWHLEDLNSLNGVEINGERVATATFEDFGAFELKPVTIQFKAAEPLAATLTSTRVEELSETTIDHDKTFILPQEPSDAVAGKYPMLQVDGIGMLSSLHSDTMASPAETDLRAVQVTIAWHDVILNVEEFVVGEDMIIELNGIHLRLGRVGTEKADVRCPTGTSFLDFPGRDAVMGLASTAVWVADDGIRIFARYVPQSKRETTSLLPHIDGDLIDPLVYSGVVHGAVAVAAVSMTIKAPVLPKIPPVRMAKIIAEIPRATPVPISRATPAPTPAQMAIAFAKPTPKPRITRTKPKTLAKTVKARPRLFPQIALPAQKPSPKVVTAPTKLMPEPIPVRRIANNSPPKVVRRLTTSVLSKATYRELSASDGLALEQIVPAVQKYQPQIQLCYDQNLSENSDLIGRAELRWEISPRGTVVANSVAFNELTPKNAVNLFECVKRVFRRMKFPPSKNGARTTPTIGLPLGGL